MSKVIIMTDSNSGITQTQAKEMGVVVLPMPFYINEEMFYEDIDLSQEQFYEKLQAGGDIKTSMPLVGDVTDKWDELLKEYDEVVYIPMSSGLSSSCETAYMLSQDYDGKVEVVNNQRISVTMRQSVIDAKNLAEAGKSAKEIKDILEAAKFDSSIYIMVDTLTYLHRGGRCSGVAALAGSVLKLHPKIVVKDGAMGVAKKYRGKLASVVRAYVTDMEDELRLARPERVFITHSGCDRAIVEETRSYVEELGVFEEILETRAGGVVSSHCGPGTLGVLFIAR